MASRARYVMALALASACSDATSPHSPAPFVIAAGNAQKDTIGATLVSALIVRVRPLVADTLPLIVTFSAVSDSGPAGVVPGVLISSLVGNAPTTVLAESAGVNREATVQVTMGPNAGTAKVAIQLAGYTNRDTATFTVLPGSAVGLSVSPHDTAIYVGGTATLRGVTSDRIGNRRTDSINYSPSGTFTGHAIGRASVVANTAGLTDTAFISIVPPGTLAASDGARILAFSLDGSHVRTIASIAASDLSWSPSGALIAFVTGGQIDLTDTLGNYRTAATNPAGNSYLQAPQFSADGQWLYYGDVIVLGPQIWRVRVADSTTAAAFLPTYGQFGPSPSPDGTKLALIAQPNNTLSIYDTTSQTYTIANANDAVTPVWMPGGNAIAYVWAPNSSYAGFFSGTVDVGVGPINVVNADGSSNRVISAPGAIYASGLGWSPDGQWVVAQNANTNVFDIINVSSGLTLPLAYTAALSSPAWRPGTGVSIRRVHR